MSISKLRSRPAVLTRQEHVKSPTGGGTEVVGGGVGGGDGGATVVDVHKTAKSTTPALTTKLLNAAATNAAVVAAATAATVAAKQQQQQQQQQQTNQLPQAAQTYLPQTSLLKIEPFVPSLTTRLRRPFGRSYTTLCNTTTTAAAGSSNNNNNNNNKRKIAANPNTAAAALNSPLLGAAIDSQLAKANAASTRAAVAARLRRNPVRTTVKRQRSKSTSSSASATHRRPATAYRNLSPNMLLNGEHTTAPTNGTAAIVTLQPNGICRITRTVEDREKQPDRINYDRRGLSAIPIFEYETQLRLLSLQHNLINIFHIPKEEPPPLPPPPPTPTPALTTILPASSPAETQPEVCHIPDVQSEFGRSERNSSTLTNGVSSPKPLRRQNERTVVIGRPTGSGSNAGVRLSLALGTTNARQLNGHALTPPPPPPTPLGQIQPLPHPPPPQLYQQLLQQRLNGIAGNNLVKNLHYNAPLLPLARQPTPCRFALKRSKSFMTNMPRQLHSIQQNLLKTQLARVKLGAVGGDARLKSFDSNASALTNATDSSSSTLATSTTTTTTTGGTNKTNNSNGTTFVGSELDEDDPLQQLTVKNRQLAASYGAIFQHLVFLDLYDNQIERIGNLDGLPALSVLLLGKNRLTDISGLSSVKQTLRVLDLHGNKITSIAGKLNCLQELKSLNLAGNLLRQIGHNDFCGLAQLRELNLKRNKIKRINGFHYLTALERLWLCHNELHRVDDMASIAKATQLLEVTIENNPVSLAGDCVSFLVSYLPHLQSLSQMPITEQVRSAAMSWRRNKEISDTHYAHLSPDAYQSIKREEVISNARTNWELLRSQQTIQQYGATHKQTPQQQPQLLSTYTTAPRIAKPSELARINESNEAVGDASAEGALLVAGFESGLQEFIKLPPIEQQQQKHQHKPRSELQQTQTGTPKSGQSASIAPNAVGKEKSTTTTLIRQQPHNVSNVSSMAKFDESKSNNNVDNTTTGSNSNSARCSGSSGSSLGPNVHSSSSCFSSDNEDSTDPQQRVTRIHKCQKVAGQQQRRGAAKEVACENAAVKGKSKKAAAQKTKTIDSEATPAHKLNGGAEGDEQISNITGSKVTTGSELKANRVTTMHTSNDAKTTNSDNVNFPTDKQPSSTAAEENATAKAAAESQSVSQVDNNSSMLMPRRTASASKTMAMPQQKAATTATIASASTAQITGHGSLLSLGFKEHTSASVQPSQPTSSNGNGAATGQAAPGSATTRTTCRRLMRSHTVVGASSGGINNCLPAAANNGNEAYANRRTANTNNNNNKVTTNATSSTTTATTTTPCNGQVPTQPTVTCIVAPPPLSTGNTTNNSHHSILGGQRATAANKAEREARERNEFNASPIESDGLSTVPESHNSKHMFDYFKCDTRKMTDIMSFLCFPEHSPSQSKDFKDKNLPKHSTETEKLF
ncbi:PREDICTED: uncharacterized protein LOC108360940 [Rhagoletis zephyria]|uniref:uncharacterized protein LOC108360940 n=1 Tax=Rhagoletis zephyria TaxID=28612 RepID=UPI0008113C39|nr:PREDICTED: uncharacterized protein LOC108360940 [Rhagoletis zephyria]